MRAKQYQSKVQLIAMTIMAVATLVVAPLGGSQSASAADNGIVNTLKISPVRSDIEIKPGASKVAKITVTNLTDQSITVRPIENDFIAGDEKGSPALILDADKYAPTHSLKRFMSPLKDVVIPAKEARAVEVKITVPADAQAGGYYGAIRFAPTVTDDGGQVNLNASAASIILLTVPGDLVEKLNLTNFDVRQNGKTGWFFTDSKDFDLLARFENKGNVHAAPFGKVSVKKGSKVVYEADFNQGDPRDMVLPDYARRWEIPLEKIGAFGHYKVSATFTYGTKNQTIDVSKSFWVVPIWMIAAAIALVVLIIAIIGLVWYRMAHRHTSHKHRRR